MAPTRLIPYQADIQIRTKGKGRIEYDFLNFNAIDEADARRRAIKLGTRLYPASAVVIGEIRPKQ